MTVIIGLIFFSSIEADAETTGSENQFKEMNSCTTPHDYEWGAHVSKDEGSVCIKAAKVRGIPAGQVAINCIKGPDLYNGKEKLTSLHFFYATWDAATKTCSQTSVLLINQKNSTVEIPNYQRFMDTMAKSLQFDGDERKRILDFLKFNFLENQLQISFNQSPNQHVVIDFSGTILENKLEVFEKIELSGAFSIEPQLLKVRKKASVTLRFRFYPSSSNEDFELIDLKAKNKVVAKIPRASIQKNHDWQISKLDLSLDTLGIHQFALRMKGKKGWITSESMEVDVVPSNAQIHFSGSNLSNKIKHPELGEIVSNVLIIQLKKGEGYARALQLANSVNMKINGNMMGSFWRLQFKDGGGVTKIDNAMKILKSSSGVLVVEPDRIIKGF